MESLAEAVDAVICEVALTDEKHGKTPEQVDSRKRFIAGASMGMVNFPWLTMSAAELTAFPCFQVASPHCCIQCKSPLPIRPYVTRSNAERPDSSQYPPAPVSEAAATAGIRNSLNGLRRPKINGAMLLCPMLEIAPVSCDMHLSTIAIWSFC